MSIGSVITGIASLNCLGLDEGANVQGPPTYQRQPRFEQPRLPRRSEPRASRPSPSRVETAAFAVGNRQEFLIEEGPQAGEISMGELFDLRVDVSPTCGQLPHTGAINGYAAKVLLGTSAAAGKRYTLEVEISGSVPRNSGTSSYGFVQLNDATVFSSLSNGVAPFDPMNHCAMHSFTVKVPITISPGELVSLRYSNVGQPYIHNGYAEITDVTCVDGTLARDLATCTDCTALGDGIVSIGDVGLEVNIGTADESSPQLGSVGRLCLARKYTEDPNLSLDGCLMYVASHDNYEMIHDYANGLAIRQVVGSDGLADVIKQSNDRFDIKIYSEDQVGSKVGGIYQLTGTPDRTFTVERTHNAGLNLTESLICEVVGSTTSTNSFTHNGNSQLTSLSHPDGLCDESLTRTTESGGTVRVETVNVYDPQNGNILVRKEIKKYQDLGWGDTLIHHQLDPDNGGEIVTYDYYTGVNDNGYKQLEQVTSTRGPDLLYDYDSSGRISVEYRGFMNGPVNRTTSTGRIRYYYYTPMSGSGDNGSIKPDEPRRIVEHIDGQVIRESFLVLKPGYREEIVATTDGTSWNSSGNLRTITTLGTTGVSKDLPLKIEHADGTLSLFTYTDNGNGTKTTTTWIGEPNGGGTSVVSGTKTETLQGSSGEIISRKQYDIASNKKTDEVVYSNFDDEHRAQDIAYFDGTTESLSYGCCGIDSFTDRNDVITSYLYDSLKRVTHETRLGITTKTEYDPDGNILKVKRIGSDQSEMTLQTFEYGLDGKLKKQINPLGGETTVSRTVLGGGQLQVTSTNPDLGTQIETFYLDGGVEKITGTAVAPMRNDFGIVTVTDGFGSHPAFFHKVTQLDAGGSATSQWTRSVEDFVGRSFRTEFAAASGTPTMENRYNSLGQLAETEDADGIVTYHFYNGRGERYRTAIDVNGDQTITENGVDRIQETVRTVLAAWGTDVHRTEVRVFGTNGSSAKRTTSVTDVSVDGLKSWSQVYRTQSQTAMTQTETVYNGAQRTETTIEPSDRRVVQSYTDNRLVQVKTTDSGGSVLTQMNYGYDVHGRQSTQTDLRNGTITTTFNAADLVASTTTPVQSDGSPQVTQIVYDTSLRPTEVTAPDGGIVKSEYFATGQVKKNYGARTYPVEYTYDPQGRRQTMKTWQDFNQGSGVGISGSATTRWNYDAYRGWLTSKDYPNETTGAPPGTAGTGGPVYTYSNAGRLATRAWKRGVTTTYSYDTNTGDLDQVSYSDSTPSVDYTYDRSGRSSTVARAGMTTTYTYNDANQATLESYSGGSLAGLSVNRVYDDALRMTQVQSKDGSSVLDTATYAYGSSNGRLATVSHGGTTMSYAYLANSGLVETLTHGASIMVTIKAYDTLNRLTSLSSAASAVARPISYAYRYNKANQRTRVDEADGKYSLLAYDSLGQLTASVRHWGDGTPISGQDFGYQFDEIGNRVTTGGRVSAESTYTVNRVNEYDSRTISDEVDIIGIANPTASVTVNSTTAIREGEYFHHELGVSNSGSSAYPTVSVTSNYGGGTSASGEIYVPKTPEVTTHDADGNLTQDGRWNYTWDGENRLTQMKTISGVPVAAERRLEFEYDYMGRRIRKKVYDRTTGGTLISDIKFLYDGWNMIADLDSSDTLLQSYSWGLDLSGSYAGAGGVGGLLKVEDHGTGGEGHYVAYDGNGNVAALVSESSGNVTARYEYGPFGEVIRATGTMAANNPFQFSTKFVDLETGFSYYGMRFYNPTTGRWISRDPIEENGGLNLYGFVGNDPTSFVDPIGEKKIEGTCRNVRTRTVYTLKSWGSPRMGPVKVRSRARVVVDIGGEVCDSCCDGLVIKDGYTSGGASGKGEAVVSLTYGLHDDFGGFRVRFGVGGDIAAGITGSSNLSSDCFSDDRFDLNVGGMLQGSVGGFGTAELAFGRWRVARTGVQAGVYQRGELDFKIVGCSLRTGTCEGLEFGGFSGETGFFWEACFGGNCVGQGAPVF